MKLFRSKILTFFLLVIMLVVLVLVYRFYLSKDRLAIKFNYLEAKINNLREENIELEEQADDLTDPEKIEQAARKLYVLTKPGESAIIIPQELLNIPPELNFSEEKLNIFEKAVNFIRSIFK